MINCLSTCVINKVRVGSTGDDVEHLLRARFIRESN